MDGVFAQAPLAPAPDELCLQRVEVRRPEAPEALEPPVDILQRARVDGVEASGALGTRDRQAALAQHAEVRGHARLRDAELRLDDRAHRTRGLLTVSEQLQDPAPHRVAEKVERVHNGNIQEFIYINQGL